jgi:hypothetical protein
VVESDDRMLISRRLLDVAHGLDELRSTAAAGGIVPIESLMYDDESSVVPIESLAPTEPTRTSADSAQPSGLEVSFRTLSRLIREQAPATAAFIAALTGSPSNLKVESPAEEDVPVPIVTLCYSGKAALRRADTVRQQIASELRRDASLETLQPLLQELLDLVPLALAES